MSFDDTVAVGINKKDEVVAKYESPIAPLKHDLVSVKVDSDIVTLKVEQVKHAIRKNRMARRNELDYIAVTVKPLVNNI